MAKEFKDFVRVMSIEAEKRIQQQLDQVWSEFENDLRKEIYKLAPPPIKEYINDASAIDFVRTPNGSELRVNSSTKAGRVVIVWECGNVKSIPYEIRPRFKKALMFIGRDGEKVFAARVIYRKVIPPHHFIRLAWRSVREKYRLRIKRAIDIALRSQ